MSRFSDGVRLDAVKSEPRSSFEGPALRPQLDIAGLRWIIAVLLLLVLGTTKIDRFVLIILAIMPLTLDLRHPMSLKNFFLVYVGLVFAVGGGILRMTAQPFSADILGYMLAFLAGYWLVGPHRDRGALSDGSLNLSPDQTSPPKINVEAVRAAMLGLACLNILFLAYQLGKYGVAGFYRGSSLLDQFVTYGKGDLDAGFEQVARYALRYSAIGLVVLYVRACFQNSVRIQYRYPLMLLIGFPIASLHRYEAMVGALTVLAVFSCDRRLNSGQVRSSILPNLPQAVRPQKTKKSFRIGLIAAFGVALIAAVAIGNLRRDFLSEAGLPSANLPAISILTSELTPVKAYGDIRSNITQLGYQHGRTIVAPLLLKVVPRAWLPDKPQNSGAYYMSALHPDTFASGFAIPPTFFGDAFLSFGFLGALAACALLGGLSARLDQSYKRIDAARMSWYLLVFANYFSLLRDPLSESLARFLLTLGVVLIGGFIFKYGPGKVAQRPPTGARPAEQTA